MARKRGPATLDLFGSGPSKVDAPTSSEPTPAPARRKRVSGDREVDGAQESGRTNSSLPSESRSPQKAPEQPKLLGGARHLHSSPSADASGDASDADVDDATALVMAEVAAIRNLAAPCPLCATPLIPLTDSPLCFPCSVAPPPGRR